MVDASTMLTNTGNLIGQAFREEGNASIVKATKQDDNILVSPESESWARHLTFPSAASS